MAETSPHDNKQLLVGLVVGMVATGLMAGVYFVLVEPAYFRDGSDQSLLLSEKEREARKTLLEVETADAELISPTELEKLIRGKSPYVRSTTLHRALTYAREEQLVEFFDNTSEVSNDGLRHEIQDAAIRRLAVIDPEKATTLIGNTNSDRRIVLLTIVFEEWSVADLDQAVGYGVQLDGDDRLAVLDGVFNARFDLSEIELREIAIQLGHEQRVLERLAFRQLNQPVDDPSETWHKLLTEYGDNPDTLSEVQIELLVHIATTWLDGVGVEAIQAIKDSSNHAIKTLVLERIFDLVGDEDSQRAFDLANGLQEIDPGLMAQVIENWARIDGLAAFKAGATVTDVFARKPVQRDAIEIWGEVDPHSLLAALEELPDEFHDFAFSHAMRGLARIDPDEALNQLNGINDQSTKARITEVFVENWSEQDPQAALQWVQFDPSAENQEIRSKLQSIALSKLTYTDARLAMDLALSLPLAETGIGPEVAVISELAKIDVDKAQSMLEEVRNQTTRESTYVPLGHALITAGRSSQAIALVNEYESSEEVQYGYLMSLVGNWAWFEPLDLLKHLEEIPIDSVKREAAVSIAIDYKLHVALTKEQRESLKKYIPEIYWEKL